MKKFYSQQGGGKSVYSAPAVETLDVSAEKGFAASTDIEGAFSTPESVGDGTNDWWQ